MTDPAAIDAVLAHAVAESAGSAPSVSLSREEPWLGEYRRPDSRHDGRHSNEAAAQVLEVAGVLSPGAARKWVKRFQVIAQGWTAGEAATEEESEPAGAYMESLIATLANARDTATRSELIDRANGAFSLYLYTGLLRSEDAPIWGGRLEEALGKTVEEFEFVDISGLDPEELEDEDDPGDSRPGELLRVVPAELERHDGMCVTAAELHENGFTLHWHFVTSGQFEPDESFEAGRFEIADDLGTSYDGTEPGGASWSALQHGPFAVLGDSRCPTPVPEAASLLTVSRGAADWRIPLAACG